VLWQEPVEVVDVCLPVWDSQHVLDFLVHIYDIAVRVEDGADYGRGVQYGVHPVLERGSLFLLVAHVLGMGGLYVINTFF